MNLFLFCSILAIFLAMTVFLALESDGFTAGMGANIPGRKRSELKVRDRRVTRKSVKTLI